MKKSPLLIALTLFLLGIALLMVPTVAANSSQAASQAMPAYLFDSSGANPTGSLTLSVEAMPPDIAVAPTALASTLLPDQVTTQTLTISNAGDVALTWTIALDDVDVAWAAVDMISGTTAAAQSSEVTVTFDSTGLEVGTYTTTLAINSNDPDQAIVEMPVMLTVQEEPAPNIEVAPTALASTQDADTQIAEMLTISNTGDADLMWQIGSDVTWATVDMMSGTTEAGGDSQLLVSFDSTALAEGSYTGMLLIDSNDVEQASLNVPLTLTVQEPPADIDVNPTELEATQGSDEVTSQMLTIENTGETALEWMIAEEDTTSVALFDPHLNRLTASAEVEPPLRANRKTNSADKRQHTPKSPLKRGLLSDSPLERGFRGVRRSLLGMLLEAGDIVMDGSFEAGSPSAFWDETSTNFGTPLCNEASCGAAGAYTGDWWAWFGGFEGAEDGTLAQDVTIPVDFNHLSFFFWNPTVSGANSDFIEILIDGQQVWLATEADAALYPAYTKVSVDISAYADGGTHHLMFHGAQPTGPSHFFVDDISISDDPLPFDCALPSDISWLTLSASSGSTAAGTSDDVAVTFDSTGLMAGDYTGNLCLESNDPDESLLIVPLTLTVAAEPAIELAKTVGTEPAICATTEVITVAQGSPVYYCYSVTNTGNITLPLHDLLDSELGTLLDDFAFELAPGATISTVDAGQFFSATPTASSSNSATWTAFGDSLSAEASASATVNVTIPTALEMAELTSSTTSRWRVPLALAAMMLVLASGVVLRRRRTPIK